MGATGIRLEKALWTDIAELRWLRVEGADYLLLRHLGVGGLAGCGHAAFFCAAEQPAGSVLFTCASVA